MVKENYVTNAKVGDQMGVGRPRSFDREKALSTAMSIFWRKGFAATSVSDLCSALAIAPPSLYAAFGSKERLYRECISHYMEKVAPQVWRGFQKATTARDAVEAFLKDSARVLPGRDKPSGCMVTLSEVSGEGTEHLRQFLEEARRQGFVLLRRRIEEGVRTGEVAQRARPAAVAHYFLCVQQGMSILARDGATAAKLRQVAGAAMKAWPALAQGTRI